MKVDVTTRDILINPEHKAYVLDKIALLEKYGKKMTDESTAVKVDFRKAVNRTEGKHVECEVTVSVPKGTLRAEVHANQVTEAIDIALQKLKHQIERYAGKDEKKAREKSALKDVLIPIEE